MNASVNDKLYLLSACNNNSPSAYSKCFLINAFLQEGWFCFISGKITVVSQFSLVTQSCLTLCDLVDCSTSGLPVYRQLLEFTHMSIDSVMPSNHLILCHPLLLLPSILPSIRVFSNESILCIRWPKYWSFSFNISPSNEYLELVSFRMDWLDLLAVQGTLKSLLQYHSSKASILQRSAFFTVQLSYPHMPTGKTIALTRWTLVGRVMSLLLNMLSKWLSDFTFTFHFHALEKAMATHSSVLAWRIPGTGEPGELLSMGSHRVRHNWSNLEAAAAASWS